MIPRRIIIDNQLDQLGTLGTKDLVFLLRRNKKNLEDSSRKFIAFGQAINLEQNRLGKKFPQI